MSQEFLSRRVPMQKESSKLFVDDGCIAGWLVRSSSAPQGSGLLGSGSSTPFHELERTDGSVLGSAEVPEPLGGEVCTSPVRQHHDSGLSEETGLCPVSPSSHPVHEDFGVLQGQL